MAHKISLSTPKGGVGKTTISYHLVRKLAQTSKVLAVDIDPQGNLTRHILSGVQLDPLSNVVLAFKGEIPTPMNVAENLDLIGSNIALAEFDSKVELQNYFRLSKLLRAHADYEFIVIDTPPNLGMFSANAMLAVDYIIGPLDPSDDSLEALSTLEQYIKDVREEQNEGLHLLGFIMNDLDVRNNADRDTESKLRERYGEKVFNVCLPRTTLIRKARKSLVSVEDLEPGHKLAEAFDLLVSEIKDRISTGKVW